MERSAAGTVKPYTVGQWVRGEGFYGREALIGEILDGPRRQVWLLGTRRVGKTSLLKQLEHLTARGLGSGPRGVPRRCRRGDRSDPRLRLEPAGASPVTVQVTLTLTGGRF